MVQRLPWFYSPRLPIQPNKASFALMLAHGDGMTLDMLASKKNTAAAVTLRYACMLQLYMYRIPASYPRIGITLVSAPAGT